jgi:predicted RNA binding protein YcfA (HicA-like mRNA interferase family)
VKLPRNVSGTGLAKALRILGYDRIRQAGSHIRLTTEQNGTHHVTVPDHQPIKLGTLAAILRAIAAHHGLSMDELLGILKL